VSGLWQGLEARIGSAEFLAEEFAGQGLRLGPVRRHEAGSSLYIWGPAAGRRPCWSSAINCARGSSRW